MPEFALATGFVVLPLAFVPGSIRPALHAITMLLRPKPLALVDSPIFELNRVTGLDSAGAPRVKHS